MTALKLPHLARPITENCFGVYRVGIKIDGVYYVEIIGESESSYYYARPDLRSGAPALRSIRKASIVARFTTQDAAIAAIERATDVWKSHDEAIAQARRGLTNALDARLGHWESAIREA